MTVMASVAYAWVFYEAHLYANSLLQLFFVVIAVYGFRQWRKNHLKIIEFLNTPSSAYSRLVAVWLIMFICIYIALQKFSPAEHFVTSLMDAFLATGSLIASYMSARKWIQNWGLWAFLNSLYIIFYMNQGLYLTSLLYLVLLMLCFFGWQQWHKNLTADETL